MPKTNFTNEVLSIWGTIRGNKGLGLSPTQRLNVVDILASELHLNPIVVRLGDEYTEYIPEEFRDLRVKDHPDEWCSVYYHPVDCESVTGSNAHNWSQWASKLLQHGRQTHPFAPKLRPPDKVLRNLEDRDIVGRRKVIRLLSIEMVVFYLACQQRTWGSPVRIAAVRKRLSSLFIGVLPFDHIPPADDDEDVDVDQILEDSGVSLADITMGMQPSTPKTRLPKVADTLVGYKPGQLAVMGGDAPADPPKATVHDEGMEALDRLFSDPDADPVMEVLNELRIPQSVRSDETMSDEAIKERVAELQAILDEREKRRWLERFVEEAKQGKMISGTVWPDRGEWATLRLQFPNGREVIYYHRDLAIAYMQGELAPSADEDHVMANAVAALHQKKASNG